MVLSDKVREKFRDPIGKVFTDGEFGILKSLLKHVNRNKNRIVTVGDKVTTSLIEHNIIPDVALIDRREKRGKFNFSPTEYFNKIVFITNYAGTINFKLCRILDEALAERVRTLIIVGGEEDLTAIPAIFSCDEGDVVLYGQPGAGIVLVIINNGLKRRVWEMLKGGSD